MSLKNTLRIFFIRIFQKELHYITFNKNFIMRTAIFISFDIDPYMPYVCALIMLHVYVEQIKWRLFLNYTISFHGTFLYTRTHFFYTFTTKWAPWNFRQNFSFSVYFYKLLPLHEHRKNDYQLQVTSHLNLDWNS